MSIYDQCWTSDEYVRDRKGYMKVWWEGKMVFAHRLSFFLHYGYWPDTCRHICDNPPCYNPVHLQAGTHADNVRDRVDRGRGGTNGYERKTHCPQGHEYTEANTRIYRGSRYCRQCVAGHSRARRARQRVA